MIKDELDKLYEDVIKIRNDKRVKVYKYTIDKYGYFTVDLEPVYKDELNPTIAEID